MNISSRGKISFLALVLLIISAVDSNRGLPSTAIFGAPLIFFFIFSAVFFLFPSSLVAAELSAAFPEEGGIYHWVRSAYGENMGMFAVWLQWVNTVVWYPTILSFIAGTLTYLFDPSLMDNKAYMICVIAGIFWVLTIMNLFGLKVSAHLNTIFAGIGTVFPMLFLIFLGFLWVVFGKPIQIPITADSIFPSLAKFDTWTALEAVMAAFVGMELSGVHVNNVPHPQKTFPRALLISSIYILATMLLGSLTIAVVLPVSQINLAGGLMQVFDNFFQVFHLGALVPLMSFLIVVGSVGGMINWLISPAKGLLHASHYGFLPPFFTKANRHGVAGRILIAQAILVTIFCAVLLLLPSVNAFYWFLTALSNCLYMAMYVLMFLAVYRLRSKKLESAFKIPGGKLGLGIISALGLIGAGLTIIFGFVPPDNVNIGSGLRYTMMIAIGNFLLILPVFFLIAYKKRRT
ncbi:MAG: APC family permease [Parachlamydiales bacterium]|nr:APC family permease [Parachlamydiales bacterium]